MPTSTMITLALALVQQTPQLIALLQQLRGSMNEDQLSELEKALESIHNTNLKLSQDIDDAAREAEKSA